ncbi:glycerophosphoryl diester phosphodiesterase [Stackebrandtia albiflava]|uniref:Glycerophosphoryl diester phosphodiesterase n=1 Tax=Stackebrandtia albiflava TaxID=406432 RepID=A0A562VAZ8_9ACTN|nr:glycerophosphodiester phosphodiesterase [Stackebrandtia albiflava]TWJ14987.1 glycerophosphoryl diester phosphodiesterase [Stackebrandtia albiflava]
MPHRFLIAAALAAMVATVATPVPAVAAPIDNPWLDMRIMNMAHSGGEREAPQNTMYAFTRAAALGADMIELDVHATADDRLVVLHDATVDATTDGTGRISDLTAAEASSLDAAHHFVPGTGAEPGLPPDSYPLRGVRTGDREPPAGYSPDDFGIPLLSEVFARFPDTPINVEIKGTGTLDVGSYLHHARLLAAFLNEVGRTDVIVSSFNDLAVAEFHELAPQVPVAPGSAGVAAYLFTGARPIEGTVALQIPVTLSGLIPVATPGFIARAHADGYAVHVWFSGTAPEDAATYNRLLDACADALMPALPTLLEDVLDSRGLERPGIPGADPCA